MSLAASAKSLVWARSSKFKLSWDTEVETIDYFRVDRAADRWITARDNVSSVHTVIFSRLPLPLNRMIGALVSPHLD
jgi:hypothetical protein